MELIIKSDNKESLAKIIALAKKLNVFIEKKDLKLDNVSREQLKRNILDFESGGDSSFGDAAEWERNVRSDRGLPFL